MAETASARTPATNHAVIDTQPNSSSTYKRNETISPTDVEARTHSATSTDLEKGGLTFSDADEKAHDAAPSPASESQKDGTASPPAGEWKGGAQQKDRSGARIALIMFALGMAVFLAALDITIITTALPTISEYFHSAAGYTWIGSAYLLAVAASTTVWGKISDVFGRKPMLLVANILFFIGSLVAALATSIGMLITARAIQGVGGGGLVTLVNITIGDLFSPRKRGAYYGMIGGVWAIASSVGPVLGGVFTQEVTWRWCFYINLPLDGIAFVIILFFLDLETPKTPLIKGFKAIDWLGSFLIVGGTLLLLFGLEYGGVTFPWDSATVLCLIIIGAAMMVAFGVVERYVVKSPLMPPRIFQKSSNLASLGVCFVQSFVFISGSYFLPIYFQGVRGVSPLLSGVYLLATTLALSLTSIVTGIFIRKTGKFLPPIFAGLVLMTIGYGLFIDFNADASIGKVIGFQIIAGLGVGPLFQAPLISLQSGISPRDIGTATAAFGFARNLATSISVVVGSVIFNNQLKDQAAKYIDILSPQVASALSSGAAGASIGVINTLPPAQKAVARQAFADALRPAWILYTAVGAFGIFVACFIGSTKLSKEHTETKTGLEAEKAANIERAEEQKARKEKKARKRASVDIRDKTVPPPHNGSVAALVYSRLRYGKQKKNANEETDANAPAS